MFYRYLCCNTLDKISRLYFYHLAFHPINFLHTCLQNQRHLNGGGCAIHIFAVHTFPGARSIERNLISICLKSIRQMASCCFYLTNCCVLFHATLRAPLSLWCTLFHCGGFPCHRAQALGAQSSVALMHRLSCSPACVIFLDQGSSLCALYWQADS